MMRVALLHAYSSENLGDGLLVDAALRTISRSVGAPAEVTVFASRPESFRDRNVALISTKPNSIGELRGYAKALRELGNYDLIVGVGGGYLRFGNLSESARTTLIHGPQLFAASRNGRKAVYLPQSIGPLPPIGGSCIQRTLSRIATIYCRDDRTTSELRQAVNLDRAPDMAIWAESNMRVRDDASTVDPVAVLSTRYLGGALPPPVRTLAQLLDRFDGYIQSQVGSNDDTQAVSETGPRKVLGTADLLDHDGPRRVVVAMRLHAALMAINAGHYVIHLAYERKGFGAFDDLGLSSYVYPTKHFDPTDVHRQADLLLSSPNARADYDAAVRDHRERAAMRGLEIERKIASIAGSA